ncbi:MAG: hypothetical protein E7019_02645 [Alphaproteobacteria bacterium]|nr:hypothetical protein [Alphaproteobacteria bacterium]
MHKNFIKILLLAITLVSCGKKETKQVSDLELKKVSFEQIEGWNTDNHEEAFDAFLQSCERLKNRNGTFIANSEIKIPTTDFLSVCKKAHDIEATQFKNFVEANFEPNLVVYKNNHIGKFTSYYEPKIKVSYKKNETFKFPIHAKPLDLIEFNPHDFDNNLPSKRLVGRIEDQKLIPYYTRDEIYKGKGQIPVLLWADSFVDVYIMHIQGPALAELPDGSQIRISYADTNGLKFSGIGSILLDNNELKKGKATMIDIKNWLLNNTEKALSYMNQNKRYVFHQLIGATGPLGAMGIPLTAGRSLAIDPRFIPLGALMWLDTTAPDGKKIQKLISAQDVGGAIKGAIRGDYFWGSGGDEILALAGKMNSEGSYYIFIPKSGE